MEPMRDDLPFEVQHGTVHLPRPSFSGTDVANLVHRARTACGPQVPFTTLHVSGTGGGTFAVRHFRWTPDGVMDSGWRCWVDGVFVTEEAA